MNLIRLTQEEAKELFYKVGDLHEFKSSIMGTSQSIAQFDIFKDIDTNDKDIYVALKHTPYDNYEETGFTVY